MIRLNTAVIALAFLLPLKSHVFAQDYSSSITASYRISRDVSYLKEGALEAKLDVYSRSDASDTNPTLIYFHGGDSLRSGGKEGVTLSLLPYLEWGWNVVNIEYHFPGITLAPVAMQNGFCALRWIVRNAREYGFDANNLVVSGSSSGGWFALTTAMATRQDGWDQPCPGTEQGKIAAVVNWYGVADFADVLQGPNVKPYAHGWVQSLPNPLEVARRVSSLTFVSPSVPPVISIHGDADPTVPYSQSVRLNAALKQAGVASELITIPGGKHGGFTPSQNKMAFAAIEVFLAKNGIPTKRAPAERK